MNFRNLARKHLQAAKKQIDLFDDSNLRYAALELRMAMEAIVYDRALSFKDEFPEKEYDTWQPKKIMTILIEIEPTTDKDSSLAMGIEESSGKPSHEMKHIGSEKVLSMKILKEHYDRLGNYLHMMNLRSFHRNKATDFERMRVRCSEIYSMIDSVLASPLFNCTLSTFSHIDCFECDKPIRKRVPTIDDDLDLEAECKNCKASYNLEPQGNGNYVWHANRQNILCGNRSCKQLIKIWQREVGLGKFWVCKSCGGKNTITYGVAFEPSPNNPL
ncbi:hypothetical protein [Salinimonas chungwhensis]|uniref:hypothetical protein n=1 Tax=Salinimonas chungwhensis TaxID=265425 RepID=UPI00037B1457|nr:hypothetical protein [Salinimonas chungwhensis]